MLSIKIPLKIVFIRLMRLRLFKIVYVFEKNNVGRTQIPNFVYNVA